MNTKPTFHGSDLEKIAAYYHMEQNSIINFGANVNPLGLSAKLKEYLTGHLDVICRYPDPQYQKLREAIGVYCNANPHNIIVGNGSTELISLIIATRHSKKALVLGPTYSEYERDLSLNNGTITHYYLREEERFTLQTEQFCQDLCTRHAQAQKNHEICEDLLIICNPNNPTSSAIPSSELEKILVTCQSLGIFVMIDETYIEFSPNLEEICAIPLTRSYSNLMVLRGISKFFSAPGLRFGYGITGNEQVLQDLRLHQNPWSLNSIAACAGLFLFGDTDFILKTKSLITKERGFIEAQLSTIPQLKSYPSYANFFLVRIEKAGVTSQDLFEFLIQKGLMVRECSSFQTLKEEYIRFCIMNPEDNTRLLTELKNFFS